MTKAELLKRIADNHNRIAQIFVRGEDAILVAKTILDMRDLLEQVQAEPIEEQQNKT